MRYASLFPLIAVLAGCGASTPIGFQGTVAYDGEVMAFESTGTIATVAVERGQQVAAGAVLATLKDDLLRAELAAGEAAIQAATAELALMLAGPRREDIDVAEAEAIAAASEAGTATRVARRLSEAPAGTSAANQVDVVQQQAITATHASTAAALRLAKLKAGYRPEEIAAARARLAQAQANAELIRARLARCTLVSPGPRRIEHQDRYPGELSGPTQPVLTLTDPLHPYVDAFVPQDHLAGLAVGTAATVTVDGEATEFPARIETIASTTEFTPRYLYGPTDRHNLVVRIRVRVDDPKAQLHAGIPAAVRFKTPAP